RRKYSTRSVSFLLANRPFRSEALLLSASVCVWCGRGDSNPYGIATASPSSWCVCQFRHFRKWMVRQLGVTAEIEYMAEEVLATTVVPNGLDLHSQKERTSHAKDGCRGNCAGTCLAKLICM